jgi:hypothetical protein
VYAKEGNCRGDEARRAQNARSRGSVNAREGNHGFPPESFTARFKASLEDALKLFQLCEELGAFRDGALRVFLRPADLAFTVDDERGALVHAALVIEHAVGLTDRAVRPVVGKQGERNAAELLGPDLQAGNGVGADLEDLDVQLLEFFEVRTEPLDLILSATGESERKKRHDRGTAAEAGERDFLAVVRREREVRRCGAWL